MNTEKIDEIIKILRAIADTSTSNKIPADFPLLRSARFYQLSLWEAVFILAIKRGNNT